LVAVWLAARVVPESKDPHVSGRPDVLGACLLALAVGLVALALVKAPGWGWGSASFLGLLAAALASGWAMVYRSRRHHSPVIELELLDECFLLVRPAAVEADLPQRHHSPASEERRQRRQHVVQPTAGDRPGMNAQRQVAPDAGPIQPGQLDLDQVAEVCPQPPRGGVGHVVPQRDRPLDAEGAQRLQIQVGQRLGVEVSVEEHGAPARQCGPATTILPGQDARAHGPVAGEEVS